MDDVWEAIALGIIGGMVTVMIIIWVILHYREKRK